MLYLFEGDWVVAVLDLHVVVGLVEDLYEDDELFYVGVEQELKGLLDDHSVVDDIDDEILLFYVVELHRDGLDDVAHDGAGLVVEPLESEEGGVVFFEFLGEDDLNDDVDEVRDGLVEFYLDQYLPLCTSLKKSF